jgi:hypothetical protein
MSAACAALNIQEKVMKQVRLGYQLSMDVSSLSDTDIAKLVILLSKVKTIESTGMYVGGEYTSAFHHSKDSTVQLSSSDDTVFRDYSAARAHLETLKDAAGEDVEAA